jgi:hypothetical protein
MLAEGERTAARFDERDVVGLKYFGPIRKLLERLHGDAAHPNRTLHCDQYVALLLLFYFNPVLKSLRDIQYASTLGKVQDLTGVRRTSLGSLSESAQVFDRELVRGIFAELADRALALDAPLRPKDVPEALAVVAVDGTLLAALPKMLWALWLGPHDHAVKVHLHYDVLRAVPVDMKLTTGQGDERKALAEQLRAGCLYLLDRGYLDYGLYQQIIDARSSFVARVHNNVVYDVVETRAVTKEGLAAGIVSDEVVWLGGRQSGQALKQPVRVVHVHVKNQPGHNLKPRLKRVDGKVKAIRTSTDEYDIWLVTDRLDLPGETIALLYRYRWQVEIFFRWFKCVLGCKHLLSHSPEGLELQLYAALIATLLIVLWTGRKPNRRTLTAVALYLQGWSSLDELNAFMARLTPTV